MPYASLFAATAPVTVTMRGELLPGCYYSRMPPVYFDMADIRGKQAARIVAPFAPLVIPPLPISLIEIGEALVFGQGSVVLPDGRLLHESVREFVNHKLCPDGAMESDQGLLLPSRTIERFAGRTLLVKRPWYRNYGHWLVDLMPIIPLVARHGLEVDTILFGVMPDGPVRESMAAMAAAFLPNSQIAFVDDERQVRCETLLYVTPPHIPPGFKHPLAMQLAADAARAVLPEQPAETPRSKLYVSRQRAGLRRIANADAIEAALLRAGFETVYPEDLSFADQVALFSRATAVVGVKGAGLANITFCRPGTEVLVFRPADFPDPFFWDLATPRGMTYAEIFSSKLVSPTAEISKSDFEVDLQSLERYLSGERHVPRKRKVHERLGLGRRSRAPWE